MTNKVVQVLTIAHFDEEWFCIEHNANCSRTDMVDIFKHCKGVGDKIYMINGDLFFQKEALFNIDLMFTQYDFIT